MVNNITPTQLRYPCYIDTFCEYIGFFNGSHVTAVKDRNSNFGKPYSRRLYENAERR